MNELRHLWRSWRSSPNAVWLSVWPPVGAFVELVLVIGAIYAIDLALPQIDVASLEPSPYWIPVLLLSLQYGTVAGLLAAGAATVVYVLGGLPEQVVEENHFTYLLRVWALPILWIGVALVLGQFRLRQIEIKQRLKSDLDTARTESQGLTRYASDLERRCQELERRITTGHEGTGAALLDALAAAQAGSATGQASLQSLAREAFPGADVAAYLVTPWGLEKTLSSAPLSERPAGHKIPSDSALYLAIVGERRNVCVLDKGDEAVLSGEGLVAVPVLHPETARVIGMLKMETAGAAGLVALSPSRLQVLARVLAPLLSEPRVIVDNTDRGDAAAHERRLTRGWRQFSWQVQAASDRTGPDHPEPSGTPDRGAGARPRATK